MSIPNPTFPKVRHLFSDNEVAYLYKNNTLEEMATICSQRAGRKLSRETMRLWVVALAKKGVLEVGGSYKPPIPVTKKTLHNLYVTKQNSILKIVEILGESGISTSQNTVRKWLCEYGIPLRTQKEQSSLDGKKRERDYEKQLPLTCAEILDLYNGGMSHQKLATVLSRPGKKVYPATARLYVLRAHARLGGELRPRIKNTWTTGRNPIRPLNPTVAGAICPKCGTGNSASCGGYVLKVAGRGKFKGCTVERAAFRCRDCSMLWHRVAPAPWVARMRETGSLSASG